ncbi:MAG TPA: 50S ribosomal protein L25, partial [Polyangiaceae bacterium]|nr:50S ribosomal protein L25 [Polyangiaceae bacterium]
MELIKVKANRREQAGKSAAQRLRAEGLIPAVAYGKHLPAQPIAVSPAALSSVLVSERGRNSVLELDVDGKDKITAMIREYQYHPLTRKLLHADFQQISLDQPIDVEIPLELVGKAAGVVLGGTLRQVFRTLPVRCLPEKIPVKISYDVTELGLDAHIAVREVPLPEGVTTRLPPEQTVIAVFTEKVRPDEEEAAAAATAAV